MSAVPDTSNEVLAESLNADGSHFSWLFWCPGCSAIHQVDNRWTLENGDRVRPTIRGGSGSILVHGEPSIGRPTCHSHVTDGQIQYHGDSTHALAGQTVALPPWGESRKRFNEERP
jgi:hypothetical protein